MRKLVIIVIMMVATINVTALAGTCTTTYCDGLINNLYTSNNGNTYVLMDGNTTALNCTLFEGGYLTLKPTNASFQEIYSGLLAVTIAQRSIRLRILEGTSGCEIAYSMIFLQ